MNKRLGLARVEMKQMHNELKFIDTVDNSHFLLFRFSLLYFSFQLLNINITVVNLF